MIVADASVLIAFFNDRDKHHARARALLGATEGEPLGASVMTLAEVLVQPVVVGRLQDATDALAALGVEGVPVDAQDAARLASWRVTARLKLPDCCVLLAAEAVDARVVLTFDERLGRAARDAGFEVP